MTKLTKGYPFAFQVLGYLCWKPGGTELTDQEIDSKILPLYDQYLEEYSYGKIWSEVHKPDRRLLSAMAEDERYTPAMLRKKLEMSPQLFYKYRKRLEQKGLIFENGEGILRFVLPRFEEFIKHYEMLSD